ncbi:MAG TPA: prepilin-type N-terminal cleavage/methylation domain-containing protein [Patescibacteria group bacterium]|nr:prepilin-type N-terminal cleavage/methylation domain-containing protein [Patescibacteria group bacterium]
MTSTASSRQSGFTPIESGFTLIELIIVFSVITVLSSLGVASFVAYSRSQTIDTAMKDFKSVLFTARSRALSQLRDSTCFSSGFDGQGYELEGYQVVACCSFGPLCSSVQCNTVSNSYELQAVYGYPDGSGRVAQTCLSKKFADPNIGVSSSNKTTATYFFFSSVTGAVTTNASSGQLPQIEFSGYGITKLATVSATGVVQ